MVQLGRQATLRCPAGGYPRVYVTWWHAKLRVPVVNNPRYEQTEDHSLLIKNVSITDLGSYICETYSEPGHPSAISITLQTYKPVHFSSLEEWELEKYVIDRPFVKVKASIVRDPSNTFIENSTFSLVCNVSGDPIDDIFWTFNGEVVNRSERVQLTGKVCE